MPDLSDPKIAHLEMLQRAIARMAGESARMKQFALASIAATASTAAATGSTVLALAGAVLALLFWGLDAQYLTQERWFRAMYDRARADPGPADFAMTPDEEARASATLSGPMTGWSVLPLYAALIALSIAVSLAVALAAE